MSRLATVPLTKRYCAPDAPFARKYAPGDGTLLVELDKANQDVCGPAIGHLLKRALIPFPFQSESRRTDEDSALARLGGATTYPIEMEMELLSRRQVVRHEFYIPWGGFIQAGVACIA